MHTLYLLPAPLSEVSVEWFIPEEVARLARTLNTFFAEDERSARAYLKKLNHPTPMREIVIERFNEHSSEQDVERLISRLELSDAAILSEAGCPCIADPGTRLVRAAHKRNIRVKPLVGPSSTILALMASGLEGQRFSFIGYLPTDETARQRALREVVETSRRTRSTMLFIETPYRTKILFEKLLSFLPEECLLCMAADLTGQNESVQSRTIAEWRSEPCEIAEVPTIFALYCPLKKKEIQNSNERKSWRSRPRQRRDGK